jgi:hypothetical protein
MDIHKQRQHGSLERFSPETFTHALWEYHRLYKASMHAGHITFFPHTTLSFRWGMSFPARNFPVYDAGS